MNKIHVVHITCNNQLLLGVLGGAVYNFISHVGGIEDKFQNKFPSHSQIIACFVGITVQAWHNAS